MQRQFYYICDVFGVLSDNNLYYKTAYERYQNSGKT